MTEYRFSTTEFRAVGRELSCYIARFNVRSFTLRDADGQPFQEILMRGCFRDALRSSPTIATIDHDPAQKICDRNSGLALREDDEGLVARIQLPRTEIGDQVLRMVQSGKIESCSFAMSGIVDSFRPDGDMLLRTIQRVGYLADVSLLTQPPAYPMTSIEIGDKPALRHLSLELDQLRVRVLEKSLPPPTYARKS